MEYAQTIRIALSLAVALVVAESACNDRTTTEECYEAWTPPEGYPLKIPAPCEWGENPPQGPEGTTTWYAQTCVAVEPGASCSECVGEEIDSLIMDEIAKECCESIEGFLRGCHRRQTRGDGTEECCYLAAYFSRCTEPGVADDPPCPDA